MMKLLLIAFSCFLLVTFSLSQKLETSLQNGHVKDITCADIHPNGKWALSGAKDNSLLLWNLENGKIIRHFTHHTYAVWSVDIHPNKDLFITSSADNSVCVVDLKTREVHHRWNFKDDVREAYFSPKGNYVLVFTTRDKWYVYSLKDGSRVNEFSKNYGVSNQAYTLLDDKQYALNTSGYKGAEVLTLKGDTIISLPFDKTYGMEFSPDGSMVSLSSSKLFAEVFDLESGKVLARLEDKDSDERCDGCNTKQVWSNNSKYILTMNNKNGAILWDAKSGKKLKKIMPSNSRPTSMEFSFDDQYVLINTDETLYAFSVKTGKKTLELKNKHLDYYELNPSPTSHSVIVPGEYHALNVWDYSTGRKTKVLKGYLNEPDNDGLAHMRDNWAQAGALKQIGLKRGFDLHPNKEIMACGGVDSLVHVIDIRSGRVLKTLKGHSKIVISAVFSPNGKQLATAGGDREIYLWNTSTWTIEDTLNGHFNIIFDLAYNTKGDKLISGSWDGSYVIWDFAKEQFNRVALETNSAYNVDFGNDDLYYLMGDNYKNLSFVEADGRETFRSVVGHTDVISDVLISPNRKQFLTASWDGSIKVWDYLSGMITHKASYSSTPLYSAAWYNDSVIAFAGADNVIRVWNIQSGAIQEIKDAHTSAITKLMFTMDKSKLISMSIDGMYKLWDFPSMKLNYSRIQISHDQWLSTHSSGRFDGSAAALKNVNYVSEMEVLPIGSLFDKYFTPNLIERVMKGENFDLGQNIQTLMEESPDVAFVMNELDSRSNLRADSDTIVAKEKEVELKVRINSNKKVINELRVYNNKKLVEIISLNEVIQFRGDKDIKSLKLKLNDGVNNVKVLAINEAGVESSPAELSIKFSDKAAQTDLFILSVGINDYKNSQYNLKYAVPDAKAFAKAIKRGGDTLFSSVKHIEVLNKDASKDGIQAAFDQIQQEIGPEDVFVFYYAGHGVMSSGENPEFYLVCHDVTNLYGDDEMLKSKAYSAKQMLDNSVEILASKQLFVLDACHSGGALNSLAQRGGGREKALAQLARSSGTYFLTASQDAQFANEAGDLKHGLFTYALLEILSGKGDNGDKKITVTEIKSHAEDRVPELSQEFHGSTQYPTSYSFGQDFPLVIVKD